MNMKMKMLGAAVAVALLSGVAFAATINFSWVNATQNTDGSPIPESGPGALASTIAEYGPCNAAKDGMTSVTGTIVTPYPGTMPSVPPDVGPGTWCGHAKHANTFGAESDFSPIISTVKSPPKPKPPSNFSFGQ